MPKIVALTVKTEPFPAKKLLAELASLAGPGRGIGPAEMRHRIKMLDKIDAATDSVTFDNAEYEILKTALNVNPGPFRVAHKDILRLIDDVLEAPDAPEPAKLAP
jgi:hypothetical protein